MKWIKAKLQKWLGITTLHERLDASQAMINHQTNRITKRIAELDKLTAVDADIGYRGPCTIILTGVYRGRAYAKFYDMDVEEFRRMVDYYRQGEREHLLRNIDQPHHIGEFSFKL